MLNIATRAQIDKTNKVSTFEEIGLCDPFNTESAHKKGIFKYKKYNMTTNIYPKQIMGPLVKAIKEDKLTDVKPPKCVFMPSADLIKQIIRGLLAFGTKESDKQVFLRFGIIENVNEVNAVSPITVKIEEDL